MPHSFFLAALAALSAGVGLPAAPADAVADPMQPPADAQRCEVAGSAEAALLVWAPAGAGRLRTLCPAIADWAGGQTAASAQERLRQVKLWQEVHCADAAGGAICALTPRQMVKTYKLHGHWPLSLFASDLRRRISLRPGTPVDDLAAAVAQQRQRLVAYLHQEGYDDAAVAVDARPVPSKGAEQALHIEIGVHARRSLRVRRIEVEGDHAVPTEALAKPFFHRGWFGLQARFRPAALRDDIERAQRVLAEQGFVGSRIDVVQHPHPEAEAVDLTLRVRAGRRVRVEVRRAAPKSQRAVRKLAPFAEVGSVDGASLEQYRQQVERYYQEHGFADAAVVVGVSPDGPARAVVVTVDVDAGERGSVREVRYRGAPAAALRAALRRLKATQRRDGRVLHAPWVDAYVRHDAEALAAAFAQEGFADAKVTPERTVPAALLSAQADASSEPLAYTLTYDIDLGRREEVASLHFLQLPPGIDADALHKSLRLQPGAPFSSDALEQDRQTLLVALLKEGYTQAEVDAAFVARAGRAGARTASSAARDEAMADAGADSPIDAAVPAPRRLDVSFSFSHRERAHYAGLYISGNFRTRKATVQSELPFRLRAPMNLVSLGAARRSLRGLNLFHNVTLAPTRPIPNDARTWLVLHLEERDVRTLDGLVSFSSDYRFAVGADYRDGNLFGRAINVNLQARLSDASELVPHLRIGNQDLLQLDVRAPHPLSLPLSLDAQALYRYQDVREYRERRLGGTVGVSRPLLSRTACAWCPDVSGRFAYELLESYREDKTAANAALPAPTNAVIGRLAPSIDADWRDNPIDPQRGLHLSVRVEGANPAIVPGAPLRRRATRFWRTLLAAQAFVPLGRPLHVPLSQGRSLGGPMVLALAINFGGAGGYGAPGSAASAVPPSETFGYGGDLSVRGLRARGSSRQLANPLYLTVASAELRAYVAQNIGVGTIQLAAFCDVGTVAMGASSLFAQTTVSVGPALRYVTPVGPLSLAYGKAVLLPAALRAAPDAAPPHGRVHFTFGYTF